MNGNLYSPESEQALIGCMLMDAATAAELAREHQPGDFGDPRNQIVFKTIQELTEAGTVADIITLTNRLQASGQLEAAGGLPYLGTLASATPSSVRARSYSEIIKERRAYRDIVAAAETAASAAGAMTEPPEQIVNELQRHFYKAQERIRPSKTIYEYGAELHTYLDRRETPINISRQASRTEGRGNFAELQETIKGMTPGRTYQVNGGTGIGKTAFALTVAEAAADHAAHVLYFSFEIGAQELNARLLSAQSYTIAATAASRPELDLPGITAKDALTAADIYDDSMTQATEAQWRVLEKSLEALNQEPAPGAEPIGKRLHIIESYGECKIDDINRIVSAHRALHPEQKMLIIIDYLQLIAKNHPAETEAENMKRATKALKQIAVKQHAAMLIISSVARGKDKDPGIDSGKESGDIEYNADVLITLADASKSADQTWREAAAIAEKQRKKLIRLQVCKQRGRETGDEIQLLFDGAHNYFTDKKDDKPKKGIRLT